MLADLVVRSIRFESKMEQAVRRLLGNDTDNRIYDYPGPDEEGELIGIWKLQQFLKLAFHRETLPNGYRSWINMAWLKSLQARECSRFVARQTKAACEGKMFEIYEDTA